MNKNKIVIFLVSIFFLTGVNVFAACETNKSYTYNEFPTYCSTGCPSGTKKCDENHSYYVCRTKCYCEIGTYYSAFDNPCNCPSGTEKCYPESLGDQKFYCSQTGCGTASSTPKTSVSTDTSSTTPTTGTTSTTGTTPTSYSTIVGETTIEGGTLPNPVKWSTFSELIDAIANWLLTIGLVLAPLMFVIGGVMFATAYGNASKIQSAKSLMIYTGIGILVVLLAKSLVEVLKGFIG